MTDDAGGTLDLPPSDQVAPGGELDPGQVIGHFVIRSRLGEGGMGIVLAAHDADLDRPVAVKVVKNADAHPAYRTRLLREAKVMARIEHPHVVRVYEVGTDRGRLFIAMELVDGVTLATWLRVERRRWRAILDMFAQVGRGLAAVHAAGLVHRDFKPDNVLVDRDGHAKVADFGLARLDPERSTLSPDLAASLTKTGMMVGTPAYMAPEQQLGGAVDARADQYSFCVALRDALIGSRPAKIEDAHWGEVPRAVRAVIERGASVDASARWPSMQVLLDALARAANRRAVVLGVSSAAAVVASGIAAVVAISNGGNDEPQPVASQRPADVHVAMTAPPDGHVAAPGDETLASAPTPAERTTLHVEASADVADGTQHRDHAAGARVDKPAGAKTAPAADKSTTVGGVVITPMDPIAPTEAAKRHNIEGNAQREMPAAHRPIVRAALRDFGYLGLTITGDDHEDGLHDLKTKLDAATDVLERGALQYAMGQIERKRGDCGAAAKHWLEARKLVLSATKGPQVSPEQGKRRDQGFRFYGRIRIAEAYCDLESGRAVGVGKKIQNGLISLWGIGDAERAHAWLAWGIADYEIGDEEHGRALLLKAARSSDSDGMRQAIATYAAAVGLKL